MKSLPVTTPELRIWVSEFSQSHCFPSLYVRRPKRAPVRRKCSGTMTMLIPRIKQPLRKNSCHLRHLQTSLTGTPAKPGMLTYPTPSRQIHVSPILITNFKLRMAFAINRSLKWSEYFFWILSSNVRNYGIIKHIQEENSYNCSKFRFKVQFIGSPT